MTCEDPASRRAISRASGFFMSSAKLFLLEFRDAK
jgi:hypothetical protein